jgi:mannose-6-phosphate isomerase-like protein (cupin superfamily)
MQRLTMAAFCILAVALAPAEASAQSDGGVTVWNKGVPPGGMQEKKDFGSHALQVNRRTADGGAEVHMGKADVFVIQSGAAALVTGGEVVDPKTIGPGEILGARVQGGVRHELAAGDVVEIPPGVPHQFLVPKGGQITYFVVKVVKPGA